MYLNISAHIAHYERGKAMKRFFAVTLAILLILPTLAFYSVSAAPNEWNTFWVTHYNDWSGEAAAAIVTGQEHNVIQGWAWRYVVVFEPVESLYGVYEVSKTFNFLGSAIDSAEVVDAHTNTVVPEGGFIYHLNYGNDYSSTGGTNYKNDQINAAINVAMSWQVGDRLEFTSLNLESLVVPTITPNVKWYESGYICTAKYRVYKEEQRPANESISIDGVLNDNCWLDYNWTSVDGNTGHWQKNFNDKSLAFKYQFRTDKEHLYGAAEIFNTPVAGSGNGSATNFRLWVNTSTTSVGATHYYDIFYSTNGGAGITPSVAGSAMVAALTTTSSSVRIEFKLPLSEIGATDLEQIPYFISCSTNNGSEEPCLYYPKVYVDAGVTFSPKNNWYRANDGDLNAFALRLNGFEYTLSSDGTYYILSGYNGSISSTLTVPSQHAGLPVKEVGRLAFAETEITSLIIPDSVTKLGHGAFSQCKSLTSVSLSYGLKEIGMMAFMGCEKLAKINLPSSLTTIGNAAFSSCALAEVTVPTSVSSVGSNAFAFCKSLTDIYCAPASKPANWSDAWIDNCDATVHWTDSAHVFETIWSNDETHHWHECTHCDKEIADYGVHIPGEVGADNKTLCKVCGAEMTVDNPTHVHTPGTAATCTSAQTCTTCGEVLEAAKGHTAGEWVTLDDGSKEQRCSVCNFLLATQPAPVGSVGDVNNDGAINQYDYILVKRHYFETRYLTDDEMTRADVNNDGNINQYDYILIKRHYFGTYKIG
ncbi:MAG: hypothetical protein E7595_05955 [Ruminococcaceae bacterium]|nr:hypothetical protein [Oscillospiraceae bacterium]